MWARGLLNSSYRKDQVKFECLLFVVLKARVTFGFLRGVKLIARCSLQLFSVRFAGGVKHLLGSETLRVERTVGNDGVTNVQHVLSEVLVSISFFSHTSSSFILPVKAEIAHPSVIIEVQEGATEHFYFLHRSSAVRQRSPASQLRPSSSIGRLKSFWQIAESKDLEKSGSRSCVFISLFSLSNKH